MSFNLHLQAALQHNSASAPSCHAVLDSIHFTFAVFLHIYIYKFRQTEIKPSFYYRGSDCLTVIFISFFLEQRKLCILIE